VDEMLQSSQDGRETRPAADRNDTKTVNHIIGDGIWETVSLCGKLERIVRL
jgi:hypothetical protein